MNRGNYSKSTSTPNRMRKEKDAPATGGSSGRNTMGHGERVGKGKNTLGHGERCATAKNTIGG